MSSTIFISHKNSDLNNAVASALYDYLKSLDHQVFLDNREFYAGVHWDDAIYDHISSSDVLILLLTPDCASPWVQREVDYARGCRVCILPVVVREADLIADPNTGKDKISAAREALALVDVQYARLFSSGDPAVRYSDVDKAIVPLTRKTRIQQDDWVKSLRSRWTTQDRGNPRLNPPNQTVMKYRTFSYKTHGCKIHLTLGDISQVQGVDVLVNSENTFMQMQRVFAPPSVSKAIRIAGATVERQTIVEDTIQDELNRLVFGKQGRGIPVRVGDVFVTTAGDESSELRQQGIRYIFHVAAVDAHIERGEQKIEDVKVIRTSIRNCFKKINENSGSESQLITSIVFPFLGTGNAGLPLSIGIEEMSNGIKEFLDNNPTTSLAHIYLAAYTIADAETAISILSKHFP